MQNAIVLKPAGWLAAENPYLPKCTLSALTNLPIYCIVPSFIPAIVSFFCLHPSKHIMQACISRYIHRWWFNKQNAHSCEKLHGAATGASLRSFGSICFGSMFVGISKLLRKTVEPIRSADEDKKEDDEDEAEAATSPLPFVRLLRLLATFRQFILSRIDHAYFTFHEFAFVYVGT